MSLLDKVLPTLPDAVIFDIDGTVSDPTHRLHLLEGLPDADESEGPSSSVATTRSCIWESFHDASVDDPPHDHIIQLMAIFELFRFRIVLCTGRPDTHRELTEKWLAKYVKSRCDALLMRAHGDWRPDHEIKSEMVTEIRNVLKLNPVMAFDDREGVAEMFQKLGIPCLLYKHDLGRVELQAEDQPVSKDEEIS